LFTDGSYQYTHDSTETTSDSFVYEISDGNGGTAQATVSITITLVNDTPVIIGQNPNPLTTPEETALAITLANLVVTDPDNTYPDDFTLSVQDGANYTRAGNTITPETSFNGTLTVPATVNDGLIDSPVFNLTVVVGGVNDPPVAVDDTGTLAEGATLNVAAPGLLANDSDPDIGDILTVNTTPVSAPANGALTLYTDGSYDYVHDSTETLSDAFVYEISDGNGGTAQATVNLTITPVNDAPVITSTAPTTATEEVLYIYQVLVDDPDDPNNGVDLTFTLSNEPTGMAISPTGLITWTPAEGVTTSGLVTVTVADGGEDGALPDTENFTITVTAVNDPPVATDDTATVSEGGTLNVAAPGLLANDSDPDIPAQTLTVNTTPVSGPTNGAATPLSTRSLTETAAQTRQRSASPLHWSMTRRSLPGKTRIH
jgi:VCBS repeat-containing protein